MKCFKDRDEGFFGNGDVDEFKKRNDRFLMSFDSMGYFIFFPYFAIKFLIVIPLKFLFVGVFKIIKSSIDKIKSKN